ncbi:MAG: enoyl-CoA hydratase-related protein, partial [Mycobacteriales bacterium]
MTSLVRTHVGSGARAGIATLTLDSPRNRNALSVQLMTEFGDALQECLDDPAVRVIVLTHTGPVFCSGADLKEAGDRDGAAALPASLPTLLTMLWH